MALLSATAIPLLSERCSRDRIALSIRAPRTPGLFFEDESCCGLKLSSTFPRSLASSALRTVARSTIRRIDRTSDEMDRFLPSQSTIRWCYRRFFQAQAMRPHRAFCCCLSAPVSHAVPPRAFLRIAERAVYPWAGLPRARPGLCRGLCCCSYGTSPDIVQGSLTRWCSSASPLELHRSRPAISVSFACRSYRRSNPF